MGRIVAFVPEWGNVSSTRKRFKGERGSFLP